MMTQEPESVEEAWRWLNSILGEQPHGRTAWDIEQHLNRVRDLARWIREQTGSLLPLERMDELAKVAALVEAARELADITDPSPTGHGENVQYIERVREALAAIDPRAANGHPESAT